MARYTGTVKASHGADEVWRYLADLRSIPEWDPSVRGVTLVQGEAREEGARYDLEVEFRGRTVELPYRITEVDPPHRVVSEAETDSLSVRDEARIERRGSGNSIVTWEAELRLHGARRVLGLPLRALFRRLGENARQGLAERLGAPQLGEPTAGVRG